MEINMKLNIEIWADDTNFLSENGYNLLNESIVCYKNGAYRSSFLTSYLAFMVTLRDRILDYNECPEYVNLETWRKIINDLDDDNLWEECIIQLLEQEQLPVQIFSCKGKASVNGLLSTNKDYLSNDFDNCIKGFEDNNLDEVREFIISFSSIKKMLSKAVLAKVDVMPIYSIFLSEIFLLVLIISEPSEINVLTIKWVK